jgi:hypothetical protein
MQERHIIMMGLIWSGRYNIPGKFQIVKGRGVYGEPVEEQIPELDHARLDADVDAIMKGEEPCKSNASKSETPEHSSR